MSGFLIASLMIARVILYREANRIVVPNQPGGPGFKDGLEDNAFASSLVPS